MMPPLASPARAVPVMKHRNHHAAKLKEITIL
jgi:hypothetical protein